MAVKVYLSSVHSFVHPIQYSEKLLIFAGRRNLFYELTLFSLRCYKKIPDAFRLTLLNVLSAKAAPLPFLKFKLARYIYTLCNKIFTRTRLLAHPWPFTACGELNAVITLSWMIPSRVLNMWWPEISVCWLLFLCPGAIAKFYVIADCISGPNNT